MSLKARGNCISNIYLIGALIVHTVKCGQSLNSVTDLTKLIKKVYDPNLQCCKTKGTAVYRGVLAPHTRVKTRQELEQVKFCSIHFDCSNHNEEKMLCVLVRFFLASKGMITRVLDIYSVPSETSEVLTEFIWRSVVKYNLQNKVVAICADNTNTNFGGVTRGGHNNVLERFCQKCQTPLFGIGCLCHIANNCIQYSVNKHISSFCPIDSFLGNLYSYFNGQTVRLTQFKVSTGNNNNNN